MAFWQQLTSQLKPHDTAGYYEALDATAVATCHVTRRGHGHLPGQANKGLASRLGWYRGFYVLASTDPNGVVTGWGAGSASCKDQPLAETFLRARACPHASLPTVGEPLPEGGFYLTDSGFQGRALHTHWLQEYGAEVITPPQRVGVRARSRGIRRGKSCATGSLLRGRLSKLRLASCSTSFACAMKGPTPFRAS